MLTGWKEQRDCGLCLETLRDDIYDFEMQETSFASVLYAANAFKRVECLSSNDTHQLQYFAGNLLSAGLIYTGISCI